MLVTFQQGSHTFPNAKHSQSPRINTCFYGVVFLGEGGDSFRFRWFMGGYLLVPCQRQSGTLRCSELHGLRGQLWRPRDRQPGRLSLVQPAAGHLQQSWTQTAPPPRHTLKKVQRSICSCLSLGCRATPRDAKKHAKRNNGTSEEIMRSIWLWVKNRYLSRTLVNGNMDYNLRSPGGLILTHAQFQFTVFPFCGSPWALTLPGQAPHHHDLAGLKRAG